MTIDSHAHLTFEPLSENVDAVIARSKDHGIETIITIGSGEEENGNEKAIALTKKYKDYVFATIGVHPHDAKKIKPDWISRLKSLSKNAIAIGETGLDFHYMHSPKETQIEVFKKQIELAQEIDLPIIFHVREASKEFWEIIDSYGLPRKGAIWHCFSGNLDDLKKAVNLGMFISFAGPITFPKSTLLKECAIECPIENILAETDSPYLAPQKHRGKTNEPAFVIEVVKQIADLKKLPFEKVDKIIQNNTRRAFNLKGANWESVIAYRLGNSLYLNITNKCRLKCAFCPKHKDKRLRCYQLELNFEPGVEEIIQAVGDPSKFEEIVFCGYGEPTIRFETLKEVSKILKQKGAKRIRLNTDGLANLAEKRDVTKEIAESIDSVSISLNAQNKETYAKICPSEFGEKAYGAVLDFIKNAKINIKNVQTTAVTIETVDVDECQKIADKLGVKFKSRKFQKVG